VFPLGFGERFGRPQPQVAGRFESGVTGARQPIVFRPAGFVGRRVEVFAEMKPVVDEFGIGQMRPGGVGEWGPQIDRNHRDRFFLFLTQCLVEQFVGGFGGPVFNHVQDFAVGAVAKNRHLVVSGVQALFIHHEMGVKSRRVEPQPPDLIVAQTQQLRCPALHLNRNKHVQSEIFKQQREATVRGHPRNRRRPNSEPWAIKARDARRQKRLEPARIEVSPCPRFILIVDRRGLPARRTVKSDPPVFQVNRDRACFLVDPDSVHEPRRADAQNLLIKFS
jgi:hypothetical protein